MTQAIIGDNRVALDDLVGRVNAYKKAVDYLAVVEESKPSVHTCYAYTDGQYRKDHSEVGALAHAAAHAVYLKHAEEAVARAKSDLSQTGIKVVNDA